MNFATALIEMCYRGHKIKRPHWKGYWKYHAGRDQANTELRKEEKENG